MKRVAEGFSPLRNEIESLPDLDLDIADVGESTGASDDGFCHIVDESGLRTHCGQRADESITCLPYNGEALCPSCGLPTCPTCAVRTDLNNRLE